jgi:hypothetical protein
MKRLLLVLLTLLVICGTGYGSFFWGFQRGYHRALILQNGTFVGSLDALDKLRAGDVKGGIERVEAVCFASANIVYGDFVSRNGWAGQFVGKSMLDDLERYRHTYRTNSAEWTPMERSLDRNLAQWK